MPRLPYGSWPSPVAADLLVSGGVQPLEVFAAGGVTWWSEARPAERGRRALLRREADGRVSEVLPSTWNVRTRVHEYGGGAWWVGRGAVFVTSWEDQRLYRVDPPGADGRHPAPVALTPEPAIPHGLRYADGELTPDGRFVVCIRERHVDEAGALLAPAVNEVVAVSAAAGPEGPGEIVVLAGGTDFVAAPRVAPDAGTLVWLAWNHPGMPWDATVLMAGRLDADAGRPVLREVRRLVGVEFGEPGEVSLVQPEWAPDGRLLVVADTRDGWWNVHDVDPVSGALTPLHADDHEVAVPSWVFGQSRYTIAADGGAWLTFEDDGVRLRRVARDGSSALWEVPAVKASSLRVDGARLVAVLAHADRGREVVELHLVDPSDGATVLAAAAGTRLPTGAVSLGRHLSFPSAAGRTAHGWFYPPTGEIDREPLTGEDGELPPLLVTVHGGPTSAASPEYNLDVQYWTSRGFALVDVDYGGSTGYGRAYRRLLDGAWGVVDIEDVAAAVEHLVAQGVVDGQRTAIRGGSAGGFTALLALAVTDVFRAGASYYGVADLAALAAETHKFESHYLHGLIGPYPRAREVYLHRSPLTHAHRITAPLLVLQGLEDEVVPPGQAEAIVAALRENGVPHAYLTFEGEQHGFRIAENIVTASESELAFYGRVFGFRPAGEVRPVDMVFADRLPPRPSRVAPPRPW